MLFQLYDVSFKMNLPLHFLLNCDDHIFDMGAYFDVVFEEHVTYD